MFIVANHNIAIFNDLKSNHQKNRPDYLEIVKNCLDALTNINHDYTVRVLVSDLLECCLLLGDFSGFVNHYQSFISYMECPDPKVYFCGEKHEFRYPVFTGLYYIMTVGNEDPQLMREMRKKVKSGFKILANEKNRTFRKIYRQILKEANISYGWLTSWWASLK